MANSSIVIFKITGNKNEVNELKEKLDFVVEKHKGAGYVSFAFLYEEYGFEYEKVAQFPLKCWIKGVSMEDDVLTVKSEFAWCNDGIFEIFMRSVYPNLSVLYEEFEPNNIIYNTNDIERVFFKNKYWLQWWNEDLFGWEFFESDEELFEFVNKFSDDGSVFYTLDELNDYIKKLDEADSGKYLVLKPISYVND